MSHTKVKSLGCLPRQRSSARIRDGTADHNREPKPEHRLADGPTLYVFLPLILLAFVIFFNRKQSSFCVQSVKDGFNQQDVTAAVNQAGDLVGLLAVTVNSQ